MITLRDCLGKALLIRHLLCASVILKLYLGFLQGGGMAQAQEAARPKGRLELSLVGTEESPILTVTLHNQGRIPIKVDGDLVFLLDIGIFAADDTAILLQEVFSLGRPKHEDGWKKRFVSLLPGQTVKRRINLRQGFVTFVYGIGHAGHGDLVTAYEAVSRLPAGKLPRQVTVRYKVLHGFREGFQRYTGIESTSLGLFEGPLSDTIKLEPKSSN